MAVQKVEIGDCREVIKKYPDNFFDCLVTSPPYFHMRDYGTIPLIYGGMENCEHQWIEGKIKGEGGVGGETTIDSHREDEANNHGIDGIKYWLCSCGAYKGELGWEPTIEMFIRDLVGVFEIIRPKMKETGSVWINLGDKWINRDLQMIPEQFALEMKRKRWILINKVTWIKTNSMPESVKRRLTRTSELMFHFVKNYNYWYDLDAVRKPYTISSIQRIPQPNMMNQKSGIKTAGIHNDIEKGNNSKCNKMVQSLAVKYEGKWKDNQEYMNNLQQRINTARANGIPHDEALNHPLGANPGDSWRINTECFKDAHFATMPTELVRIPILATCPIYICKMCGKPRERVMKSMTVNRTATNDHGNGVLSDGNFGSSLHRHIGWLGCECRCDFEAGYVLDPFAGSGTVLQFCHENGRNAVGIDIKPDYKKFIIKRAKLDEPQVEPMARTVIL